MLTFQQFFGFLLAAMLITASPGPDNLMVLSMSVSKGKNRASPLAWDAESVACATPFWLSQA